MIRLPPVITPEYARSLDNFPGMLTLKLRMGADGQLHGVPFVVPGGRFNEMYGWDSYFEVLGLLVDGRILLSQGMVDNFVYEIQHYGKILNANRSYYLTRSQPPFLTDMAIRVYRALPAGPARKTWLAEVLRAAIKEYRNVWMSAPRFVPETGLSRFHDEGYGTCNYIEIVLLLMVIMAILLAVDGNGVQMLFKCCSNVVQMLLIVALY